MKTITGHCESSKEISVSKASKILSKFVSADNGASHVINAYLLRASTAFNELNQLHKELKPAQSHRKNRRSHTTDDSGRLVESSVRIDVKLGREVVGSVVGRSEKRDKKDGKKKLEFGESVKKNGSELNQGDEGRTEGKKQKSEKKNKKKEKSVEGENVKVESGGIVPPQELEIRSKRRNEAGSKKEKSLEVGNVKGQEQHKEVEKKLSNGVKSESGGLVGSQDVEIRSKKKHEAGSENKLHAGEEKTEQRKKRKNEDAEERSGEKSKKKMKRKHEG